MLIRIFLIVFGVGFLVAGISTLSIRLTEPGITETSIDHLQSIKNLRRVRITGGVPDASHSAASHGTFPWPLGFKVINAVYCPYLNPRHSEEQPVKVVVKTRNPKIKDAFWKYASDRKSGDREKEAASQAELAQKLSTRITVGGLLVSHTLFGRDFANIQKAIPNLSDDVIIVEEGKDVSIFTGIGYLACSGFAALVGWIIRPQKPSGPPPIPPHLRKAS